MAAPRVVLVPLGGPLRPVARLRLPRHATTFPLISAAVLALLYAVVCGYMALVLTRASRAPVARTPAVYGLAYENVQFQSRVDRLTLRGWLIAPPGGAPATRPIVSVHGKGGNRENGPGGGSLEIASHLARAGHTVLTFDLRGSGESAGEHFTLGAQEVRDLASAIDYLETRGLAPDGVGVIGYSMGAATTMLQAANDPRIRTLVEDAGYADLGSILDVQVPRVSRLPRFFTPGTLLLARPLLGVNAYAIRPIDGLTALATRGVPLLVIHGEADTLIPASHGRRLAAAYGPGAQSLFVPGAEHVRSYVTDPTAYLAHLLPFFAAGA
jgi:pimeloyl-ACP methyl ester carboxylesterase